MKYKSSRIRGLRFRRKFPLHPQGFALERPSAWPVMLFKTLTVLLLSAATVLAAPTARALPSGTVTCGSNKYSVSAIEAAINAGVKDMDDGDFPGK
jgi:hypothetical protein